MTDRPDDGRPDLERGDDTWDDEEPWTDEDERRCQARRHEEVLRTSRRRRQAGAFLILVLLVLGTGVGAAGVYQGWWEWPFGREEATRPDAVPCPAPGVTAAAPAEVTLVVLNATDRAGLAGDVAAELQARGFVVSDIANDAAGDAVTEPAQVRHGPEGLLAAMAVAAQISGAVLVDDGRAGAAVELSLGAGYKAMNTPEGAAALSTPTPAPQPSGCVPVTPSAPAPAKPAPAT